MHRGRRRRHRGDRRTFDSLGRDAAVDARGPVRDGLRASRGGGIAKFFNPTDAADNRHQAQTSASSALFPKRIEERKATALDAFLASKTRSRAARGDGGWRGGGEAHGGYGAKEKGEALGEDGAEEKEEEGDAAFVTCAGAARRARRIGTREHADYHVALDLSRETRFHRRWNVRWWWAGRGGGRRRTGASGSFKAKSLTSFFGKK